MIARGGNECGSITEPLREREHPIRIRHFQMNMPDPDLRMNLPI